MQKSQNKKNAIFRHNIKILASILIVVSLVLTSTLSVVTVRSDYDLEGDSSKDVVKYTGADFSYIDDSSFSKNVDFDDTIDSFDLLPKAGQDKILGGKENLKNLREQTLSRIQAVKNRLISKLSERYSSFSSGFPILRRLFANFDSGTVAESSYGAAEEQLDNNAVVSQQNTGSIKLGALGDTVSIGNGSDGNITVVPESGHIMFMGQGSMDLNMVLDINGTIVSIIGLLNIGPDVGSVEIWWNLSQGYFEITCDGYFEFTDLYLNIDDSIIFVTSSLVLDANGHIMIDHNGFEGDLYLDGVLELTGLSFDVNLDLMGGNVSFSGSFDFSSMSNADDFGVSWDESGISASGSFVSGSELNIHDFSLEFNSIFVNASLITLHSSAVFEFTEDEDEGVVLCGITSIDLLIQDLYLGFGEAGLFIDSITVDGNVEIVLQIIDPEQYITKEEGHIGIGGCFALSVDTTIDVNGTIVVISGTLKLDYGYLNIDWDKEEGFFKISATTIVEIDDFSISIDGNWVSLGWDEFIIFADGYLLVEQIDDMYDSVHLVLDGCSEITGVYFDGVFGDFSIGLSVGSILFIEGSLLEITMYNNTVVMDLDASLGYGLIIHDFDFEVMGFDIKIAAIIVMGSWKLYYDNTRLDIETDGFIEILNFSVGNNVDGAGVPLLGAGYLVVSGESEISIVDNGTILIGLYSMESYIHIGSAPMVGWVNIELYGNAWVMIDLVNGSIYGRIDGYGFVSTGDVGFGGILITGISVAFKGSATFSLVGSNFTLNANFRVAIRCHVSVAIDSMLEGALGFKIHNFNLKAYADVTGFIVGSLSAIVNLATGQSSISGGFGGCIVVDIRDIVGWGEDVWAFGDLSGNGKKDFLLKIDSIKINFRDQDLHLSISLPSMGITAWGSLHGGVTIEGLTIMCSSDLLPPGIINDLLLPGTFHIDLIELNADVVINPSNLQSASIQANANLYIENFKYSMPSGIDISLGSLYLDTGLLEIFYADPINSDQQVENLEIRIDGSGSYLTLNNLDVSGKLNLFGSLIVPSAHIDRIQFASETSSFSIYYGQKDTEEDVSFVAVLNGNVGDGDGLIHIEGLSLAASIVDEEGNTVIGGSANVGMIDLALEGYIKVYKDGTVEASCVGSFTMENLGLEIDSGNGPTEIALVDNLNIAFGGLIIFYPSDEEGKPPVIDVEGLVTWNADGNIESDGSIYVDGRITVDWEREIVYNPETGEWEEGSIWYVDIKFDSTSQDDYGVYIAYFSLSTIAQVAGVGEFPISFNIVNYVGTGMFEFSVNSHTGEIFMENQVDGAWQQFGFTVKRPDGTTALSAEVYHFWGDFRLSMIDNKPGLGSDNGYQSYLGFKFSTDKADNDPDTYDGLDWVGDLTGPFGYVHVSNIHLDPGTNGIFDIYSDANDPSIMHFRLSCFEGSAEMVFYITGGQDGKLRVWFEVYADEENAYQTEFPNLLDEGGLFWNVQSLIEMFKNGETPTLELLKMLATVISQVKDFNNWLSETFGDNCKFLGVTGDGDNGDLTKKLLDWYENNKDGLPEEIRERLEDLLRNLYAIYEHNNGGSCFLKGTKIEMFDGSLKNIEEIVVGDHVSSYNVETAQWTTGVVTEVFHHSPEEMTDYYLVLNNDLRITPNHPIMVDGVWIDAGGLKIGDNFGGNSISSIECVYERVPTYNFEVAIYHTYNVVWGESAKSIVHNAALSSGQSSVVTKAVSGTKNPCFLADTKIGMTNGSTKYIQDIEVGDQVLSYDFDNSTWVNGTVVEVDHHTPVEMPSYYMVINNDLRVTPNHPVYVIDQIYGGKWIAAGDLLVGQELDGQVITSIRQVFHRVPTYNFKVEPYHNYKVVWGETSSIAHENESLLDTENPEPPGDGNCGGGHSVPNQDVTPPDTPSTWGDKSCFLSGTKVEMSDGSLKNIEEIKVGDNIKSYDESTGEQKTGVVSKILHHMPDEMTEYYLVINNDLKITPNHPIMVDGVWIDAGDLKIGDNFGGNIICSIEKVYSRVPTFNFEVEPYHTYNIVWGENANSVVHNAAVLQEDIRSITSDKLKNLNPCFLRNTKIQMEDGSLKNIQEIEKGDIVKAFDTETNSWKTAEVKEVFHHDASEMTDYYLIINNDLRVTPNHPIYVDDGWIFAGELKAGDNFGGEIITSIEKIYEKEPTYNFDVEPYHTYNVVWGGTSESVVHNAETLDESSSSVYTAKTCISGTKYGVTKVADAGLNAEIDVKKVTPVEPFEMVPKSYIDNNGVRVVINDDNPVLTEDGTLVETNDRKGYLVSTVDDSNNRKYAVEQDGTAVATGLKSIEEVETYLREIVVNHGGSSGGGGSCCFPAGTMISMADGTCKPIESVNVGENVLSYDTKINVFVINSVKEIVSPVRTGVYSINNGLIMPTDDHPFYTMKSDGTLGWAAIKPEKTLNGYQMETMQLEIGDRLFTSDEEWIKVESIEYCSGSVQTYNLEDVSGSSNFFANNILVHNAADCGVSQPLTPAVTPKTTTFSTLNYDGDSPVGMSGGIPVQFIGGGSFITFGNMGVSASTQIFVVNKLDIYPPEDENELDAIPMPEHCCLPAGTIISMYDRTTKYIEDIQIGDMVLSYDLEQDMFVSREVTNTIVKQREAVYSINNGLIMPTDDHPLYVSKSDGRIGWAAVNCETSKLIYSNYNIMPLEVGDLLFTSSGWVEIKSIVCKSGYITTYTFTVDETHNYFANGVLVSNENAEICEINGPIPIANLRTLYADPKLIPAGTDKTLTIPIATTMDNIYYPAESVSSGDIIRAYDVINQKIVNATVENVTMSLTEGKYVDISLIPYSKFQCYQQQLENLELYKDKIGSDISVITQVNIEPDIKLFVGRDQFIYANNGFIHAENLKVGDIVKGYEEQEPLVVSSVEIKRRVIPVYNITLISSNHCFFGDDILLGDYVSDASQSMNVDTCFLSGTKISMFGSEGELQSHYTSKNIEDIKVGDIVSSYSLVGNSIVGAEVSNIYKHTSEEYLKVTLSAEEMISGSTFFSMMSYSEYPFIWDENNDYYILKITSNHPIYTILKQKSSASDILIPDGVLDESIDPVYLSLKTAKCLNIGDKVLLKDKQTATVISIQTIQESVPTYNIEVETYHNYFADEILVGDKQKPEYVEKETNKQDEIIHSPIKITVKEDEKSKSGYISDTICFDYYNEIDYSSTYFKENKMTQKSSNNFNTMFSDLIKKLVEKFPMLKNIKFFQKYLENDEQALDEIIDPEDDGGNEQENTPEDTTDENQDDSNNVPDEEIPVEPDTSPEEPEAQEDDPEESDQIPEEDLTEDDQDTDDALHILPPIQKPATTSLQSELLSIIDENRVDEYQQIHYIWDFGDGTYKYGKDAAHNYNIKNPLSLDQNYNDESYSFSSSYLQGDQIEEIVTYLVTLLMVDNYGNVIDVDMTSVTIDLTWSLLPSGYALVSYSIDF